MDEGGSLNGYYMPHGPFEEGCKKTKRQIERNKMRDKGKDETEEIKTSHRQRVKRWIAQ